MVSGKAIGAGIAVVVLAALGYEMSKKPPSGGNPIVTIQEKIISEGAVLYSPEADYELESVTGYIPITIQFTATASGGEPPYSFAWDFGDTGTGIGNPISHTFSTAGSYTVKATATDSINNTASGTDTVTATAQVATAIAISLPSQYLKNGSSVSVKAKLTDNVGNAIAGQTMSMQYGWDLTFPQGTHTATATTDSTGTATFNLVMPSSGTGQYDFVAQFAGNAEYLSSSSLASATIYAPLTVTVGP